MKKIFAYLIVLTVLFSFSCASHPYSHDEKYETIPYIVLEQPAEVVSSDAALVIIVEENELIPGPLSEKGKASLMKKLVANMLDSHIIRKFTLHGSMSYDDFFEEIFIEGFEQKSSKSSNITYSYCGDMHMVQCDKVGLPFCFESVSDGSLYYFTGPGHLKNRNCIVDEEKNVIAQLKKGSLKISQGLTPQEQTDVIQCISQLLMYWYFY